MKIAVLGSAPSSRMLAPFKDPEWEIWSCSPANMDLPRTDVFFEIHGPDTTLLEAEYNTPYPGHSISYIDWCKQLPRVYMQEVRPEFPGAIQYPMAEMSKRFGDYFWTSSLAYMLALAIDKKPEVIGLWGVDMSAHDEYGHQRPGCHYFIQEAQKAGIQIYAPPESDILEPPPPYGYRESSRMWWKMNTRWKELHGKRQQTTAEIDQLNAKLAQLKRHQITLEGAMEDAQYICNTFHY
jgi:hypothetical protein